jgi:hypothetical protein
MNDLERGAQLADVAPYRAGERGGDHEEPRVAPESLRHRREDGEHDGAGGHVGADLLCYVMLREQTCYVMLCYVMLREQTCYVMLCYVTGADLLCHVMLCYVMLREQTCHTQYSHWRFYSCVVGREEGASGVLLGSVG